MGEKSKAIVKTDCWRGTLVNNDKEYKINCMPIGKWDLQGKKWYFYRENKPEKVKLIDRLRAFSIAKVEGYIGLDKDSEDDQYDITILINGMRAENYSTDGKDNTGGTADGWGMKYFIEELDNTPGKHKVMNVLLDYDGPHEEEARLIAKLVASEMEKENCSKVYFLGMSKGGRDASKTLKYLPMFLKSKEYDHKLKTSAYAMPGLGTIFAAQSELFGKITELLPTMPNLFWRLVVKLAEIKCPEVMKERIESEEKEENAESKKVNPKIERLKQIFDSTAACGHMDLDIRPPKQEKPEELEKATFKEPNKATPEESKVYDPNFIKFDEDEIAGIRRFRITNIVPINRRRKVIEIIRDALQSPTTVNSILLGFSASILFKDENSDGMVTEESARAIEQLGVPVKHVTLVADHDIGSSRRIVRTVLGIMRCQERTNEADISR